ncbi:MAG: hypothetical protein AABO41_01420 [Acidobacteriota bacterium]
MSENWLQTYLVEAVQKQLCTQIHCTTCGAREFRLGVLNALAMATDQPPQQSFDRQSVVEIARALAEVQPVPDELEKMEDAVRCLLFDLWSGLPFIDRDVETILDGTWAGRILRGMQEHQKATQEARRELEEYEDPVNVEKRREEKKRLKQEKHQERLALKKDRDQLWRERPDKMDSNE